MSYAGHTPFKTLEALDKALVHPPPLEKIAVYASHPMGTCRMSGKKDGGVVKSTGESWQVGGLYLADASIFPSALGVNPQITVMTAAAVIAQGVAKAG